MAPRRRKAWVWPNEDNDDEVNASDSRELTPTNDGSDLCHAGAPLQRIVVNVEPRASSFFLTRRFLFSLGIFLGTLFGIILITTDGSSLVLPAQLALILEQSPYDIHSLTRSLATIVPDIDIDWSRIEVEWEGLKARIPEPWKLNNDGREFKVGEKLKEEGLSAKYPVILVPGIISTNLESWSTSPEYRSFFRQKVWGSFNMISQVAFNREKWMASLMLDPVTGLDPPDVKVRSAQGIDAASSFVQGFWIWSKIVENLAVVGYDTNNLFLAAYDWRLSYWNLEERDGYFSRMKASIEEMRKRHDRKVVLVAHSMGSSVVLYFLKWAEASKHGGGGPTWVEDHIEAFISVAGTHLGVPKAMSAFLSGEMKDTVELHPMGAYVLEQFFSRKERARLFRSWAGSASMWIKGGNAIWGNSTHAPDDPDNRTQSHGNFFSFRTDDLKPQNVSDSDPTYSADGLGLKRSEPRNMTADEAGTWILEHTPVTFQRMMDSNFSCGIERNEKALEKNDEDHRKWSNPLEVRLPNAPSMKIFCAYGHGKDTERSYYYSRGEYEHDETSPDVADAQCPNETDADGNVTPRAPLDMPLSRRNWIDFEVTDEKGWPKVRNGVKIGEGDGTVSLLSLGAMCAEGWKRKRWNPGGIKIVTTELPHLPTPTIPRGGANTSDHVDILGSTGLNELILRVVTGDGDRIGETYVSNIREYVKRMQWD